MPAEDIRPVLHHQTGGPGDRARVVPVLWHREKTPGRHFGTQRSRRGYHVSGRAAGAPIESGCLTSRTRDQISIQAVFVYSPGAECLTLCANTGNLCDEGACSAGSRSEPKTGNAFSQTNPVSRFCDCCAAEREQAPSPQKPVYHGPT